MQSRTRPWSSDDHATTPGDAPEGLWGPARRDEAAASEPEAAMEREVAGIPDELVRPTRRMDPATSSALESLRPLVQPPPPPQPTNRTLSGFAPRGSTGVPRASEPPPLPQGFWRDRRTTPSWSPRISPAAPPAVEEHALRTDEIVPPPDPAAAPAAPVLPIAAAPRPSADSSNALWGWAVAAGLAAFGIAFYVLAYAPLRGELTRLAEKNASQQRDFEASLNGLRTELVEARQQLARPAATQVPVAVAAEPRTPATARAAERRAPATTEANDAKQAPAKQAAASQPAAATPAAAKAPAEAKQAAAKKSGAKPAHAAREADHADTTTKGVDREAAAAATAALEAEAYGSQPKAAEPPSEREATASEASKPEEAAPPPPAPEATDTPEKKDALGDLERGPSDDPLEGL